MRKPKVMFADIASDIVDAERMLDGSYDYAADIDMAAQLLALRSIAHSQMAIAKLLLRREVDE